MIDFNGNEDNRFFPPTDVKFLDEDTIILRTTKKLVIGTETKEVDFTATYKKDESYSSQYN